MVILIADDDLHIQRVLADSVRDCCDRMIFAGTAHDAMRQVVEHQPDLILLDLHFPDSSDLGLLRRVKDASRRSEAIVISGQSRDARHIVEAVKAGAYDFISKPFIAAELKNRVAKALEAVRLRQSRDELLGELRARAGVHSLLGESDGMRRVRDNIQRLAEVEGSVLIVGETGTGKEMVARMLHDASPRREAPFVVANCAALPEGLTESILFGHKKGAFTGASDHTKGIFEAARNGTAFLDEIGDMPIAQQTSLLRVLEYRRFTPVGETEERTCRARFVMATNANLLGRVEDGRFREDLFYRISVATIELPPLRERTEDVPLLAQYFCQKFAKEMGRSAVEIEPAAMAALRAYRWPGNVRELKNVMEAAAIFSRTGAPALTLENFPKHISRPGSGMAVTSLETVERQEIVRALKQHDGNKSRAAKMLGINRNTLRAKMIKYGLEESTGGGT